MSLVKNNSNINRHDVVVDGVTYTFGPQEIKVITDERILREVVQFHPDLVLLEGSIAGADTKPSKRGKKHKKEA